MRKNFKKGFTLIELLVVIAIIGILASVVLAATNSARSKGSDAAIQSNLDSARAQAELWYSDANTYTGVCGTAADTQGTKSINANVLAAAQADISTNTVGIGAASSSTVAACNVKSDGTAYAAEAPLKAQTGKYWCIDSTGVSKLESASTLTTATTVVCG